MVKNVLIASAELREIATTGGLGTMISDFSKSLRRSGVNVAVIMPKYGFISEKQFQNNPINKMTDLDILVEENDGKTRNRKGELLKTSIEVEVPGEGIQKIPVYLVGSKTYFKEKDKSELYASDPETGYNSKFLFFSKAVLEAIPWIAKVEHGGFKPDVIHCNDWHTGPVLSLLNDVYRDTDFYKNHNIGTVFTVHNGIYPGDHSMHEGALVSNGLKRYLINQDLRNNGQLSFMKTGLKYADFVNAVSPSNAKELATDYRFTYSFEMLKTFKALLNDEKFIGITNGVRHEDNNPANLEKVYGKPDTQKAENTESAAINKQDEKIDLQLTHFYPRSYQPADFIKARNENKRELQKQLGLTQDENTPIILLSGRLCRQKGVHLLFQELDALMQKHEKAQFIIKGLAGPGEKNDFEKPALAFEQKYPGRFKAVLNFDRDEVTKLYAASDMHLMPSEFEPCGIAQMEAALYGVPTICSNTGGLDDTIVDQKDAHKILDPSRAVGFKFAIALQKLDVPEGIMLVDIAETGKRMSAAISRAIHLYQKDPAAWQNIVKRNMETDFSWDSSVKKYHVLYQKALEATKTKNMKRRSIESKNQNLLSEPCVEVYYHRKETDFKNWKLLIHGKEKQSGVVFEYKLDNKLQQIDTIPYAVVSIPISDIVSVTGDRPDKLWMAIHKNGMLEEVGKRRSIRLPENFHAQNTKLFMREGDLTVSPRPYAIESAQLAHIKAKESLRGVQIPNAYDQFSNKTRIEQAYGVPDLGAHLNEQTNQITFKLWSPSSKSVRLILNPGDQLNEEAIFEMKKENKGVWSMNLPITMANQGKYRFELIDANGKSRLVVDPYAKVFCPDTQKAIIDLEMLKSRHVDKKTNASVDSPQPSTIYDLRVQEFTGDTSANVSKSSMRSVEGVIDKINHIVNLGVDAVLIRRTITDETNPLKNFALTKGLYHIPQGIPFEKYPDPMQGINAFKAMVKAFHDRGIKVFAEVSFKENLLNELALSSESQNDLQQKKDSKGKTSSSNFQNTNQMMYSNLLIDALAYQMKTYDLDGFKIDSMQNMNVNMLRRLESSLKNINQAVVLWEGAELGKKIDMDQPETLRNIRTFPSENLVFSSPFGSMKAIRGFNFDLGLATGASSYKEDAKSILFEEGSMGKRPIVSSNPVLEGKQYTRGKVLTYPENEVIQSQEGNPNDGIKNDSEKSIEHTMKRLKNSLETQAPNKRSLPDALRTVSFLDDRTGLSLLDQLKNEKIDTKEVLQRYKLAYAMLFGYQGNISIPSGAEGYSSKHSCIDEGKSSNVYPMRWDRLQKYEEKEGIQSFFSSWIHFRKQFPEAFNGQAKVEHITVKAPIGYEDALKARVIRSRSREGSFKEMVFVHNLSNQDMVYKLPASNVLDKWMLVGKNNQIDKTIQGEAHRSLGDVRVPPLSTMVFLDYRSAKKFLDLQKSTSVNMESV